MMDTDLNLIITPKLFLEEEQPPENYRIVGPIFARLSTSLLEEVLIFIQREQQEKKRIIYFAMGSSGNPRMLRKILFSLQKQPDLAVIASIGYLFDDIQSDSEDLLITEYLSSHLLHGFIDFSFIRDGERIVQTACKSGKPFIGAGMQFEQSCNVDYCMKYENAIAFTRPVIERGLQIALRRVSSPKIRQQAYMLQATFPINGPQQAIQEIETFPNNHPIWFQVEKASLIEAHQ